MARGDAEKKKRWSDWITAQLNANGVSATDLARASDGALTVSTVSNWTVGRAGVSPESAVIIADILRVSRVEALREAGYPVLAEAVADAQGDRPPQAQGIEPDPLDAAVREGIEKILALTDRSPERQARMIARFKRRVEIILEDMELAEADARDTGRGVG